MFYQRMNTWKIGKYVNYLNTIYQYDVIQMLSDINTEENIMAIS